MNPLTQAEALQKAAELIQKSRYTIVLTGAGISTPSGIPDFRSAKTGLWTQTDPFAVASLSAFRSRPDDFFNWLRPLAAKMGSACPNAAHTALADLEKAGLLRAVITQNIDGLHQKAGSRNVIEVHGSAERFLCLSCRRSFPAADFTEAFIQQAEIPRCPQCGKIVKPDIVLFEEMLPVEAWTAAEEHCRRADLIWVIGSSLEVFPAATLPDIALRHGARLIINTLSGTPFDELAALRLPYDVTTTLPALSAALL